MGRVRTSTARRCSTSRRTGAARPRCDPSGPAMTGNGTRQVLQCTEQNFGYNFIENQCIFEEEKSFCLLYGRITSCQIKYGSFVYWDPDSNFQSFSWILDGGQNHWASWPPSSRRRNPPPPTRYNKLKRKQPLRSYFMIAYISLLFSIMPAI